MTASVARDPGAGYSGQKKARSNTTWPFGRSRPQQIAVSRSYLPVFPIGGVTTSLCCAQAPSPKAVTITATIMIVFNSFNLSRLLSPQVAPVCLGREQRGSNAFSQLFWMYHKQGAGFISSIRSFPRLWSRSLFFERKHRSSKQWPKWP